MQFISLPSFALKAAKSYILSNKSIRVNDLHNSEILLMGRVLGGVLHSPVKTFDWARKLNINPKLASRLEGHFCLVAGSMPDNKTLDVDTIIMSETYTQASNIAAVRNNSEGMGPRIKSCSFSNFSDVYTINACYYDEKLKKHFLTLQNDKFPNAEPLQCLMLPVDFEPVKVSEKYRVTGTLKSTDLYRGIKSDAIIISISEVKDNEEDESGSKIRGFFLLNPIISLLGGEKL